MFKVGDKVRVVDNTNGHGYSLGAIVTLQGVHDFSDTLFHGGADESPWLNPNDIELVTKKSTGFAGFIRNVG